MDCGVSAGYQYESLHHRLLDFNEVERANVLRYHDPATAEDNDDKKAA